MMNHTPLNPDKLYAAINRAAARAFEFMDKEPHDSFATSGEMFEYAYASAIQAVKEELAVAQPVVNTVGELNALPIGTVVYAANNIGPAERFSVGWMGCGNNAAWATVTLARDGLPARVLYRPEVKA